jgi:hypothetical protein
VKPKPLIVQARIESGELKVPSRKFLLAALKGWPDCAVDLEIRPFEERRHDRANRYYWGVVLKMMAAESGASADDLHEQMKQRHNSKIGVDLETGEEIKIAQSTAKMTVQQFSDYIEAVMLDGATYLGLTFPEPRSGEEYREGAAA